MKCLFGHKWDGCKCSKCGKIRDEGHTWKGCVCSKCGKTVHETRWEDAKLIFTRVAGSGASEVFYAKMRAVCTKCGQTVDEGECALNEMPVQGPCSAYHDGQCALSSDNRDITAAADKGDKRAQLARDMLTYQIKKYIGAYAAIMNGLDAVLFTGGIGENADDVRADVCKDMEYLGIKLDASVNTGSRGKLLKISAEDSKVQVWVVPTNEELLIARDTLAMVQDLT